MVLAYPIREMLQSFLEVASIGPPTPHHVTAQEMAGVVASAQRLLAALDVVDDAAAPSQEHTQSKFHRCFAGNALIPGKHRNDRWARLVGSRR